MAKIFKSVAGDLRPTFIPTPNSQSAGNCSNISGSPRQVGLKRREMLVASTSVPVPVTELLLRPSDQVSSLTDYHNLQNAQKLKFKYASDVDVASLFPSSDGEPPVEVRVNRPALSEEFRGREEEVVIEGIKVRRGRPLLFDVYMRREEKNEYYCGSFIIMPPQKKSARGHQQKRVASCSLRLGIGHLFQKMDAQRQTSVIVKLMPRLKMDGDPISVESIRIDYSV